MTSLRCADDFLHSLSRGIFKPRRPHSIGQTLLLVLGFAAFAPMGCATTIAAKYPHLDRRAVCALPPEIEPDSTEFVFTENNVPVSGFHPEIVDRVAATARTVFEYDPNADPSNVRYLPAPYDQLECAPVFSMLPSKDAETPSLPEASLDLLVHERRPEVVPRAIAEKLASCPSPTIGQHQPIEYTMTFNVYVEEDGHAVSALLVKSTLGDRNTEGCFVNVLRTTSWPVVLANEPEVTAALVTSKMFLADGPMQAPNLNDLLRGPTPSVGPPQVKPGGARLPFVGTFSLLGPALAGGLVFIAINIVPRKTAPPAADELNPITHRPYTSIEEYEQVQRLSTQEILQRQLAHIKATQPQPPPAPAPLPAPVPPPATGTRRNPGQTCEDAELDRLQKEKGLACNSGYAVQCPKDLSKPKKIDKIPCSAVKLSIQQRQACLAARWAVQDKCFGGKPDDRHEPPLEETQRGIDNCEALKVIVCAPGHPMAGK